MAESPNLDAGEYPVRILVNGEWVVIGKGRLTRVEGDSVFGEITLNADIPVEIADAFVADYVDDLSIYTTEEDDDTDR
jgi:hypothetical protein